MRQILYISDSRIGDDVRALDRLMIQARTNNALAGITGVLWTDGARFAQVIEGDIDAITRLLELLRVDPRHTGLRIVEDGAVAERRYGDWWMLRPATDPLAGLYHEPMLKQLERLTDEPSRTFRDIVLTNRGVDWSPPPTRTDAEA